ncbi:hypothetical protein O59_001189 [Cellvibrio sp. BR]|uniref:HPF/RaiA family ribosome-associated protein n=1 Tax=Cellvibrio TaxID=10 RepID=UPI00026009C2|nr:MULTISPECIES: HPF/RaiA family ribosome-associated protein [Cellvibrio]EIK42908.1 hypothetical protein O59_001189 [Cellvibrio sp. BR]QEY14079.1 hypothetical protein D0B88_18520 [Cellvibrio sp. KY-YJ-3]
MQIQVNTDKNIPGKEGLARQIEGILSKNLGRFSAQLTRVEVHLSDENGAKSGRKDKRCLLEARLAGREPAAVTGEAGTIEQAVAGASQKMVSLLDSELGKLSKRNI